MTRKMDPRAETWAWESNHLCGKLNHQYHSISHSISHPPHIFVFVQANANHSVSGTNIQQNILGQPVKHLFTGYSSTPTCTDCASYD